ncbi:PREDICTED: olfactory receptor 1L4-like [Nanorana parkeri]|uniref:olfactory receptor 1L4-like n=1 Tax=Nanorana parkeri TaxID=125878 RepID=UPI000854ED8C|nr:PREDICTED: olfactory receptor 1L4-like [Nanorana parkeri]
MANLSTELPATDFILVGFSDYVRQPAVLFPPFLTIYMLSVLGNFLLIYVTIVSPQLQSPMYFFLSNLSLVDLCLTTVVVPRLLLNLLFKNKTISFPDCIAQVYFFIAFAGVECFILTCMAYDRYVAVCKPLYYITIMNRKLCLQLVLASWIINFVNSILHTLLISRLSFCGSRLVQHFFCDLLPLFKLSCSDTSTNQLVIFTEGFVIVAVPFLVTLISYIHIIWTILKIPSSTGKKNAFSTCSAHLTVVMLFYGTMICVYFRPSSAYSLVYDKLAAVLYTVCTPMLNPFIYSWRNKDVKNAFKKVIRSHVFM